MSGYKKCIVLLGVILIFATVSSVFADPRSVSELLSAPAEIGIGGIEYVLDTYMWRDFMPISPPDGKPLIAKLTIMAFNGQDIPDTITPVRVWVIKDGQDVWETPIPQQERPKEFNRFKIETVVRDGPKWGPGIDVDVIVELHDEKTGKSYLLKAPSQTIKRTD